MVVERYAAPLRSDGEHDLFAEPWHGIDGPLSVSQPHLNPLNQVIVKAFQQAGAGIYTSAAIGRSNWVNPTRAAINGEKPHRERHDTMS